MATRQNKKRKGRQNINNRERTVTTLTEDSGFLPPPSDDALSIPTHYAGSVDSNSLNSPQKHQPYSPMEVRNQQSFSYGNYLSSMHDSNFSSAPGSQQQKDDNQYLIRHSSNSNMSSGQNDLEVLEKLKETIKNGQHEFFRAVPMPSLLARVYLGPASSPYDSSMPRQVPPHPEQVPSQPNGAGGYGPNGNTPVSLVPSGSNGVEFPRRARNYSIAESWDELAPRENIVPPRSNQQMVSSQSQASRLDSANNGVKSYPPSGPSAGSKSHTDLRSSVDIKSSISSTRDASLDLGTRNSFSRPSGQSAATSRLDQQQTRSVGDSGYGAKVSGDLKSANDGKDVWPQRHGQSSQDDRLSRQPLDHSDSSRTGSLDAGRLTDRGYSDRERERDRDRERDNPRDRSRERRYDRFYDRRLDERPRIIDNRRPPADQRHWEPPRRSHDHGTIADKRPDYDLNRMNGALDDRSLDDRPPSARISDARNGVTDDRRNPLPSTPSTGSDARRPPLGANVEDRNGRQMTSNLSSTSAAAAEDSVTRNTLEDRATTRQPPPGPKEDRKVVPLEDRIGRTGGAPPSLQDRLNQPLIGDRASNRPPAGPTLEERLSQPSSTAQGPGKPLLGADDRNNRQVPGSSVASDRIVRPNNSSSRSIVAGSAAPDDRQPTVGSASRSPVEERGRPAERFAPPTGPVEDRKPHGNIASSRPTIYNQSSSGADARGQSATRDEVSIRDYRSNASGVARAASISRDSPATSAELRPPPYRDPDRYGADSRRMDLMDLDRYSDTRPQSAYRRPPSLPPQHQHQPLDTRERGVWDRQRWPSPPPRNDHYPDESRFRTNAAYQQGQWADYDGRSRGWEDKDRQWEQNDGWTDRRVIERDSVAPVTNVITGWETRQEREQREQRERDQRRISYGASGECATAVGYEPRPLSSRLTDAYAPPDDRSYAADMDAPGIYSSPAAVGAGTDVSSYPRIRQRSPSPAARGMSRPPMKRSREEYDSVTDYYSPHAPGAVAPGIGAAEYVSRLASPVPSTTTPGYYDNQPSSSGAYVGATSAGSTRDRDYPGSKDSYPTPATYDRRMLPPRTSPQSYQRGNYVRDDRRYAMPQSRP